MSKSYIARLQQLSGIPLSESAQDALNGGASRYSDHTIVNFTIDEDKQCGTEVVDLTGGWDWLDDFLEGDHINAGNLDQSLAQAFTTAKGYAGELSAGELAKITTAYHSFVAQVKQVVSSVSSQFGSEADVSVYVWGAEYDVNVGVYVNADL